MELYSTMAANGCLACYLLNPELTTDTKYPIAKEDFTKAFHQVLFVTIYNLYIGGCKNPTLIDINEWLKPYEAQYNIYKDNDGDEYIKTITEIVDSGNFDYYYDQLRKFSCLRYYQENKYDVSEFYDVTKSEESQLENLNKYSIQDIINHFDSINLKGRQEYLGSASEIEENSAGDGLNELLPQLREKPLYGVSFLSDLLNAVTRGMVDGQLTCFSSPSGVGKSSICAGIAAMLCATEIWDEDLRKFVPNPHKTRKGCVYLQFELDNVSELSLKFLAYITNIPVNRMLDGNTTDEENERLARGAEILKESNIHMVYAPNFTRQSIDDTVKSHIINYDIDLFIMDYIQEVPSLNAEMVKANGGVGLRTDQILAGLSAYLKEVARRYNIPVYTCTQTNANLGTSEAVGVESIAGSRAVANKLDIGGVFLNIRPKEEKALQEIEMQLDHKGFHNKHATHIFHMYKTRFGSYPQNVKVWVNFDNGTCRMKDCFCTDWQNKLIKVQPIKLIASGVEGI